MGIKPIAGIHYKEVAIVEIRLKTITKGYEIGHPVYLTTLGMGTTNRRIKGGKPRMLIGHIVEKYNKESGTAKIRIYR